MVTLASPQDWSGIGPAGLLGRMSGWLGATYGDVGAWKLDLVKDTVRSGRNGVRIYHAIDPSRGLRLALKAHSARRRNVAEFRALRRLHAVTEDSVRPLYLSPTWCFYAMEWVEAPSVETWLQGPDRHRVLRKAGAWLSHLHGARPGKPVFSRRYPLLRLDFRRGVAAEVAVAKHLRKRQRQLLGRATPVSMLHDDFHPANLAFDGTRIIAMDRKRDVYGVPYFDVAKFLIALEIAEAEATRPGQASTQAGERDADRRSFFAGYGPVPPRDAPILALFEDILIFRAWRHRRHSGDHSLDPVMRRRGLLDLDGTHVM